MHSCLEWAPLTQGWFTNQVLTQRALGARVHVVCKRRTGAVDFPDSDVSSLDDRSRPVQLWERLRIATLEGAAYRHLHGAVSAFGPQVLHSHFANVAWTDLAAVRNRACAHVMSVYGYDIDPAAAQFPWLGEALPAAAIRGRSRILRGAARA
jgi:hypothetical protein